MVLIAKGRLKKVMTKTMMKPTMEEYVTEVRGDYYSSITKTMINGKAAYELKGKFLDDLRNNAFSETNEEDAIEHIESFLKIIDSLELPHTKWPACSSNDDGFCSGGELPGMVRVGYMTYFQDYKWYDDLIDGNLKEETLKQKAMNERNDDEAIREEGKPNDNHGIGNFDNDLVGDNPPYHASEEEEQYEEASKKYKTSETTSGSAQGGFNLNDEAGSSEEEIREERPIGRDLAKKKASSSSSRSATSSVAGGGLVDLVADEWKNIKSASRGKKKGQQDSYIQLKNRELDIQDAARREATEL
ncbi:hypothetical protein Tco_0960705, partial [Tanacetum coccineum]